MKLLQAIRECFVFGLIFMGVGALNLLNAAVVFPSINTSTFLQSSGALKNPTLTVGDIRDPVLYTKWMDIQLLFSPLSCFEFTHYFCNPLYTHVTVKYPSLGFGEFPPDFYLPNGTKWVEKNPYFGAWASDWDREGRVETGDFDGDGIDDFVHFGIPNDANISVAFSSRITDVNAVNPNFSYDIRRYQGSQYDFFYRLKKSVVGDFDGDGRKDIALLGFSDNNAQIVFLFSQPDRSGFELRSFIHDVNRVALPGQGTAYLNNFSARSLYSKIEAGDFDGDGKDDIFISGFDNFKGYGVIYMKGRFAAGATTTQAAYSELTQNKPVILFQDFPDALKPIFQKPDKLNIELHNILFGHFDGDSKQDFTLRFYHSASTYTFLSNGTTGFRMIVDSPANGERIAEKANPTHTEYEEYTGLFEVIHANYGWTPGSSGRCSDVSSHAGIDGYVYCPANQAPYILRPGGRVVSGDFNGDGLKDFAILHQVSRFENENGTFDGTNLDARRYPAYALMPVAFSKGDGTFNVVEQDYQGNRQLVDFASRMSLYSKSWVEEVSKTDANGNTYYVSEPRETSDLNIGSEVIVADFNGDGKDDIALRTLPSADTEWRGGSNGFGGIPVAFSLGDGRFDFFSNPDAQASWFAMQCKSPYATIRVGDFNGDRLTDIAIFRKEPSSGASAYVPIAFSTWGPARMPIPAYKRAFLNAVYSLLN